MDKFEQHIKRMKGLRDVYEVGTGQHNVLSMLITECEIALRQPPVSGLLGFDEGYEKGWTDATSQAINEIQKNYKPNGL